MGTLPPAGLRENAGFDVETVGDEAGLLGAGLAVGGLLTGVGAAARQSSSHKNDQMKSQSQPKAEARTNLLPVISTWTVVTTAFLF